MDHALRKRLLPFWCSYLAHAICLVLLVVCFGVSVWIGLGFSSGVALMWLISGIFSFLSSFLLLEPLKVLLEAIYFSLVAKRLHPEDDDTLVEHPLVEHVSEKISKVRPPQGFALFQAKEEARKVKLLHRLLKNFLVYMLFLLAILLTNYGDASHNSRAFLLQSSIRQQLGCEQFLHIKRSDEFWVWMSQKLLPYLYDRKSGQGIYSTTLGSPRLRQIHLQEAECPGSVQHILDGAAQSAAWKDCVSGSNGFDTATYAVGWESVSNNLTQLWTYSPPDLAGVWYWGFLAFYDSGGYVQELGTTLEESMARLEELQQNNWINNMSQAVFVELTQYNPGLGLYAVITLRLEFPAAEHPLPAVAIAPVPLLPLSKGVTLQLLMMACLMIAVVYLVVSECLALKKAGRAYFALGSSYSRWLVILLTTCTVVVHLSQATVADRQWAKYLKNRRGFTSFYQVAALHTAFSCLAATLLFLLTIKASQQLRFIRQWSAFGKTLQRSAKELFGAGLAFAILTLAYAQIGFLLFSSRSEAFGSFCSTLQLLFTALRSSLSWRLCLPQPVGLPHLFCATYVLLELWVALRLFATVLVFHYRETHFEMYRPAFESQDYEMVELFVRRLKMWMGFSKGKEFRHKVRFEGMEPLPSRSSSQDSQSLEGPTPSATSDSSRASTSSGQLDGLSLAPSTRDSSEGDVDIRHVLSILEVLLVQFDRVNKATEDVFHMERQLEGVQSWWARRRPSQRAGRPASQYHLAHTDPGSPLSQALPDGSPPSRPLSSSVPSRIVQGSQASLLVPPKAHPSLMPATRKKKPLGANNRVHPCGK